VVILDARDVDDGPIATLVLPTLLPGVSHVAWLPASD
jgi:carotenoid cleavage dioxygenase-like enzyme